ncbi:MAG: hypothetical protein MSN52_01445 [Limosilactobacillus reuteri]|nr:hypothetical protein [Limosilactobacillus reuteri]
MSYYNFLDFELVSNNDGNARYEFREPRFNQAIGYIIVKDDVIIKARSFMVMDGPYEDTRGYPFDKKNVRDCAIWITGNPEIGVMISTEANDILEGVWAKAQESSIAIDDQIFNAFMKRG